MMHSYIPGKLQSHLQKLITSNDILDFTQLDNHLKRVESARAEAMVLRSLSDNISRKRTAEDDDEAAEARAEKKRKKEEEERAKKNESHGIRQLKKVDTSGMKKLSSFFAKAPAKANPET
jgi:hypothetical protein